MRVLITGGTGFLGRHLAWRLKRDGAEVTILGRNDRIGGTLTASGIAYVNAQLSNREKMIEACRDKDYVIHSGGLASPWGEYRTFFEANVEGTRNVIEGCRSHGVKRLLYLSTPSVYFDYTHRLQIKGTGAYPLCGRTDGPLANARHYGGSLRAGLLAYDFFARGNAPLRQMVGG